ncbi:hypothetical protein QBZ16_001035 [Prototheca wickerhamii]|uniref:Uncharacterized protein n=1 Tax=Prototheca wickerhamii TaxID=3111 RepID=A0AAD9IG44_PROWI|nr:hypothetical protein QBZ16_001035 [Prototheca wickerhamii]
MLSHANQPPSTPQNVQGLEAFSGVGRLVENLANTLDDVIGQAFKDWSTPLAHPPAALAPASGRKGEGTSLARAMDSAWDDFQVADKDWEADLYTDCPALDRALTRPAHSSLHRTPGDAPTPVADDLATEQVTEQMKTLLDEKARLAQENARLRLENEGLKELLAFTLAHQAELMGDHELFVEDDPVATEFPGG